MNSMDILDAIGAVDDVLLKKAKEKQKSHKAVWTAIGSLAACFLLLVTLPMAFIVFRGADSMAPECADQANGEAMGSDYVYVRIDVASSKDAWSFVSYDSLKAIHEAIVDVTGQTNDEDGKEQIEQDAVKDESFPAYSTESASKPKKGEYIITLRHNDGSILEYRLYGQSLTDMKNGTIYSLTKEQADNLLALIEK